MKETVLGFDPSLTRLEAVTNGPDSDIKHAVNDANSKSRILH